MGKVGMTVSFAKLTESAGRHRQTGNLLRRAAALAVCALLTISGCSSGKAVKAVPAPQHLRAVSSSSAASSKPSSSSAPSKINAAGGKTASSPDSGTGEKILNVKNIQQTPELQSGCEVTAAAILLNYFGYDVTKTDLLPFLPNDNDFFEMNGKQYGPNPWKTFAGSPDTDRYGCYAPVISNVLNDYLLTVSGRHVAYNLTGLSVDKLYKCVDAGLPVIVWVTIGMAEPSGGRSWYLIDTGENYQWILKEHCMVLIGHTQTQAVFSDPYDVRGTVSYDRSLFEKRYKQLFSQAVAMQ